jgi:hypothetical protein
MPDLSRDLRRALASTIEAARAAAEAGAADALRRLGVFNCRRPVHLDDARNETRKRLRAHAKSLGDRLDGTDGEPLRRLIEATAYVQWHRLLAAATNGPSPPSKRRGCSPACFRPRTRWRRWCWRRSTPRRCGTCC